MNTSAARQPSSPTQHTVRYRMEIVSMIQCGADTFYCGEDNQPIVLTASAYNTIKDNLNSCPVDCSNSAASPNSTTFYWQVSNWSTCSVACSGGLQTRDVVCHSAVDGSRVSNGNCDQGFKPAVSTSCNQTPCAVSGSGLTLGFTDWGECSVQCGSGYSQRTAYCINPFGALADLTMCGNYSGVPSLYPCPPVPKRLKPKEALLTISFWSLMPSSLVLSLGCKACGRPLFASLLYMAKLVGLGSTWYLLICGIYHLTILLLLPNLINSLMLSRACTGSAATCPNGAIWNVGPWTDCSVKCNGGVSNRTVGKDACVCTPGFSGTYCEVPPACGVINDVNGNCCKNGIVSQAGICCGPKAVLDRDAECCESGNLDACGKCNGSGKLVDVQNVCCNSTVLDGGGYCCLSGLLDECGVCDGDGSSCQLHVVLSAQVTQESLFLTLTNGNTLAATFAGFAANMLGVDVALIEVKDLILDPATPITSTTQAIISVRGDFIVTPPDSYSAETDLSAALATRNLQDSIGSSGADQLFTLESAELVERQSICGNLVCEAGERPTTTNGANGGCTQDCRFGLALCPTPAGGGSCSGVGWCLSTQGICQCYLGYAGDDCSLCDEGYVRSVDGKACIRNIKTDLPNIDRVGSASLAVALAIGIALASLGGIFMCITIIILYRWRKEQKRNRRRGRRSSKQAGLLSPDRQDSMTEDGEGKSRSESMLDVARGLSASLQNIRREFSGQSPAGPQRSAHSLGGLPVGALATGRGATRSERGLSATKSSGLSSSKKRGDAMRRAAASRLADKKEEIAAVPAAQPSLQTQTSSRRTTGDTTSSRRSSGDTSKAAHFLLRNPQASMSMLKRSPSGQKTVDSTVEGDTTNPTPPTQGEAGASPFEYSQGRYSNEPILGGGESPTRNPLTSIPEASPFAQRHLQSLASASSGELSTSSSRALLGNPRGSG
ncbi:hypothetical protein ABBQ32_005632 [Trebouxia sp. C0010 RCD-2024]